MFYVIPDRNSPTQTTPQAKIEVFHPGHIEGAGGHKPPTCSDEAEFARLFGNARSFHPENAWDMCWALRENICGNHGLCARVVFGV